MKYQDIDFYIVSESKETSAQIGSIFGRKEKTYLTKRDIPELYTYLSNSNNFTCFVFQLSDPDSTLENMIKAVFQKNPSFPIILISSDEILLKRYRYFIRLGVADIFIWNKETNYGMIIEELMQTLNLRWRNYLHTLKENEKIYKATVVTANHEINQPLTVILNAIGLLKAELAQKADKDSKIFSHFNFISKGTNRIQTILTNLRRIEKPKFKEYTPGVSMIDMEPEQSSPPKTPNNKINYKDAIILVEQNLAECQLIENEIKKMGLDIIVTKSLKEAELYIDMMVNKIHAIIFSSNLPATEVENTIYELNSRKDIIQIIIIKNEELLPENSKLIDSSAFQILHKPINSRSLHDAITNSIMIVN